MAPRFAQDVARRLRLSFRDRRYSPSVFQIRYRGYKGVVTVDPTMREGPTWLKFLVVLLRSLGISSSTLLRKQNEHLVFLAEAVRNPHQAFRFLCYVGRPELAERVLLDSLDAVRPQITGLVHAEYDKMLNKRDEQRCRILVPQSRLLFGVCDAWDVLKEGECAVKVTRDGDGLPYALKNTEVLVTRNPCLHPGDLQKFRVVENDALSHLVDCIVFPTRGRRPSADMMSGGDLDGDTFFVCWDSDLVPSRLSQPAEYPGAREPIKFNPITDDDRLLYFAKYTNASLGRVKNLYLDWARVRDPMAPECQELNRLFSQCVDGNRIKVPPRLEKPPQPAVDTPRFILDELHEAAKATISRNRTRPADIESLGFDALELLLCRDDIATSEFELVKLVARWCRKHNASLVDFLPYFDLNALTAEEKNWILAYLPPLHGLPSLVLNALRFSNIVTEHEISQFKLNDHRLGWKRVYDSTQDRLGTFLDTTAKTLELFHKKLIVLQVDERLALAIYVPQKVEKSQDCLVDDSVRVFAFPQSKEPGTSSRLSLPTKKNYRLYCDDNLFQLFEGQRANTWIFIGRGASDDSAYRNTEDKGDRWRQRQGTLDSGQNFDCRVSVALNKFSQGLQRHIGRVNRNGVLAAEIYVISNRDIKSMKNLDLWLQYIETGEVIPLFEQDPKDYSLPTLAKVDWSDVPARTRRLAQDGDLSVLGEVHSATQLGEAFRWLHEHSCTSRVQESFDYILSHISNPNTTIGVTEWRIDALLDHIRFTPSLAAKFTGLDSWSDRTLPEVIATKLQNRGPDILKALILSANEAGELVIPPFEAALSQLHSLSFDSFSSLVELCASTVKSPELAMDLLLQCLERESSRLLYGRPAVIAHFTRNIVAIALDHIAEAQEQKVAREDLLNLKALPEEDRDGYPVVEVAFRIDAKGSPETSAHVRFTVASPPANRPIARPVSIDALVVQSQQGLAKFQCFHPLPAFLEQCSWTLTYCGSFVTSQTMLDAMRSFANLDEEVCGVSEELLGLGPPSSTSDSEVGEMKPFDGIPRGKLNASQLEAVNAALTYPLVSIWGPPGTGKTQTIVEIILGLQSMFPDQRILVTAPTHNAVDNVMRRYLDVRGKEGPVALRVSTEVRKVAEDLRKHTLDGMAGAEIYSNHAAMREAKKRIQSCQIAFTTCIGAGIGLLRSQNDFDIVIIDEASQQTEPASLVPLTKGCRRAVLVGDHVQLRPTVQSVTAALGYDVSLFERLYTSCGDGGRGGRSGGNQKTCMLNTQYRMHPSICAFSSEEFYRGELRTGMAAEDRPLPASAFPWPKAALDGGSLDVARTLFIECAGREDLGQKSKRNRGQADLCRRVCQLLSDIPTIARDTGGKHKQQSIAVLTPYTAQMTLLKTTTLSGLKGDIEVSSIDGFQGREADIVVFVTVRCNERGEIGFLKDLRRMNVALTRARAGLIVLGNEATLTGAGGGAEKETGDDESKGMWKRLLGTLTRVELEE
ncbi:RNA dependent RNA polymerase-domain-containing protein [Apiospora hydei]|uniref:RNA-dependent RNA polymerase n=1 Tax=Apiospora hydei TaxID=1337664 RepID=A0ABR1V835_9PEZI